jgi:hypothetical protein
MTQRDLFERIEEMAEKAREKRGNSPAPEEPAKVILLPVWPDAARGVPNGVLRSALFGAIRRGRRKALDGEIIPAADGITIRYTGWRLDQSDLDVWEYAVHLARVLPLGEKIYFSANAFLKAINRDTGLSQHEWLKKVFRRLTASAVEITINSKTYMGPLIHDCYRDEDTGRYVIVLNPQFLRLYREGWTQIEWDERLALKGQPLAQWLHGFYSTHAEAFPMKVETLHRLCGSEAERMDHFRQELREALEHLARAAGWTWEIDRNDLVYVKRQPSRSQQKHLGRKALKPRKKARHSTGEGTA